MRQKLGERQEQLVFIFTAVTVVYVSFSNCPFVNVLMHSGLPRWQTVLRTWPIYVRYRG